MRVLVTGASGFLGWNLALTLSRIPEWEVHATHGRNPPPDGLPARELDLENEASIADVVEWSRPEVVIHAAAMSGVGQCEAMPEQAMLVNAVAVERFARILRPTGAHFILCSTDLVYDGLQPPYAEDDPPTPAHVYGQSKVAAERALAESEIPWAAARLALMFGDGPEASPSFLGWLDAGLRSDQGVAMFDDEYRTPLYVKDAVEGLRRIAESRAGGFFHLGGPERASRAEFARVYAEVFHLDASRVRACSQRDAGGTIFRPPDVSLVIDKASESLGFSPLGVREALLDLRAERGETAG